MTRFLHPFQYFVALGGSSGGHPEDLPNALQDRNDVYYSCLYTAFTCLCMIAINSEMNYCIS